MKLSYKVNYLDYRTNTRRLDKAKLNAGVPFYGYAFNGSHVSTMNYEQIVKEFSSSENYNQLKESDCPILYYNSIPTIKQKTQLAMQSAGGVMIWELMYDSNDSNSPLTAIDKTAKGN